MSLCDYVSFVIEDGLRDALISAYYASLSLLLSKQTKYSGPMFSSVGDSDMCSTVSIF